MSKSLLRRTILFIVGFMLYITIEVCYRSRSYAIMGVCGGITFVIVDMFNDRISWDLDILLQGLFGSCVVTTLELIVGEIAKHTDILPIMWDYSNTPLNFDGVICVPFSLIWIVLSIFAIFIADAINYYVFGELPLPYYKLFGKTIITFNER